MLLEYGCNPTIHVVCVRRAFVRAKATKHAYACIVINVLTLDSLKGEKKDIKAQKPKWFLHLF